MKWLWFSLVVAALVGCVKPDSEMSLAPTNPIPSAGGSGGAPTGGGGAGGAAAVDPLKCESMPPVTTPAMLHADAAAVLTVPMGTCNFSSCHNPPNGKSKLRLQDVADLNAALVGVMSCQAPTIPLVAAGGGDPALQNSWLWLKMTSPTVANDVALVPDPAWGPGGATGCDNPMPSQLFGVIMPKGATKPVAENKLGPIRRWICGGAPGPQ
jgi:hypothetical protein